MGSVENAMRVLDTMAENQTIGVTELANTLQLDKSLVYRLLSVLKENGYVDQDLDTRKYRIGAGLVILSSKVLGNSDIYRQASPILRRLADETHETAHLAVLRNNHAVYIGQERGCEIISVNTEMGQSEPVHCTAIGKALLAFLPEEEIDALLTKIDFKAYTPRTITSPEVFKIHLREIREKGYTVDDEELHEGVRCIAAPIMSHQGMVVASIGISGPAIRLTMHSIPELAKYVVAAAREASAKLGYLTP